MKVIHVQKKTSRECLRNIDAPGVTWLKLKKSLSVKDMRKIWPGLAYAQRAV
jgi:hypothetical protein